MVKTPLAIGKRSQWTSQTVVSYTTHVPCTVRFYTFACSYSLASSAQCRRGDGRKRKAASHAGRRSGSDVVHLLYTYVVVTCCCLCCSLLAGHQVSATRGIERPGLTSSASRKRFADRCSAYSRRKSSIQMPSAAIFFALVCHVHVL